MQGDNLQDILRILTLWFNHGSLPDVEAALQEGFAAVSIDTWLVVIPQVGRCFFGNPKYLHLLKQNSSVGRTCLLPCCVHACGCPRLQKHLLRCACTMSCCTLL